MELATYLDQVGLSQTDFAAKVETTVATISRIAAGTLRPGLDLAYRIEAATGGKVPLSQWVKPPRDNEPQDAAA